MEQACQRAGRGETVAIDLHGPDALLLHLRQKHLAVHTVLAEIGIDSFALEHMPQVVLLVADDFADDLILYGKHCDSR